MSREQLTQVERLPSTTGIDKEGFTNQDPETGDIQSNLGLNTGTYLGEGEWDFSADEVQHMHKTKHMKTTGEMTRMQLHIESEDLMTAQLVRKKGYPNMFGARIPVKSRWNIKLLEHKLQGYHDKQIIEGLKFGWPTGRLPSLPDPEVTFKNHKGATDYTQALREYINKEKTKGAIIGPFKEIPFQDRVGISPLSTRPKRQSLDRRVIVDLSFPPGKSVNDGMIKDNYLGFLAHLKFPRTDDQAMRIAQLGKNTYMFKVDLARYFRQIPLDPGDYSMIGYIVDGEHYFDKVLPMGMRLAPYIVQRITDAIRYIHEQLGFFLLNYVDDFLGAETRARAQEAFHSLIQLLEDLRVETSPDKVIPPTTRIEFLGITFDSQTMTMEVSEDRIKEILMELNKWNTKGTATRKELESLIGKLQFASKCVKPGRTFIARLLNWLRTMNRSGAYPIPQEARKDIA